jgi:hypothetical protein
MKCQQMLFVLKGAGAIVTYFPFEWHRLAFLRKLAGHNCELWWDSSDEGFEE